MRYQIDEKKKEEGLEEFMKDETNKFKTKLDSFVKYKKMRIDNMNDEELIDSKKDKWCSKIMNYYLCLESFSGTFRSLSRTFRKQVSDVYIEEMRKYIHEKINEIVDYNPEKLI